VLPTSTDSFPHLIQKRKSQLGFATYLLTYPRTLMLLKHRIHLRRQWMTKHFSACTRKH